MNLPAKDELLRARSWLEGMIHHTPVLTSTTFNEMTGTSSFFKCENFQRMGAYKMRGASHALVHLSHAQQEKGVITHSSGNFGQALALAGKLKHVKATIVMPDNSPPAKIEAVRGYGANVVLCAPSLESRESTVSELIDAKGYSFIHPSNDLHVILGNSTLTEEFVEQVPGLSYIITPVGGGGLLAGTALAAHWFSPLTEVWAAEPEIVDDAFRSLQSGKIETNSRTDTIADGLRTNLGDVNFPIIHELVKRVLLVSEEEIVSAMRWVWERMKIVIEPSSAVAVAAVIRYKDLLAGKRVGIVITGGNVDMNAIPWCKH